MNWQDDYKRKLTTFEEAAQLVRSGETVSMGFGPAAPSSEMYEAILNRHEELKDVVIVDALQVRKTRLYDPAFMENLLGRIDFKPQFGGGAVRGMYKARLAEFVGGTGHYTSERFAHRCNVFILQVSPPNDKGYVNLGLSNFYARDGMRFGRASGTMRLIIGEVNDQMPRIFGDNWAHVSEFDYFIEHSSEVTEFGRPTPKEVEKQIAEYVAEQIKNGDTIQMGFGSIPEAVIPKLEDKRDLGVLSEMFPMGLPEMVAKGIITNARKPFHKGITISTFCLGTRAMYDYVSENPKCEFYPAGYTNNPMFIAQHPNMKTLNMAIFVDLTGQIASEGIGHRMISGPGGQLDFQIGGFMSKGGFAMTVLTSARKQKDGSLASSIVPELPPGTPVTVPRTFADYIITEYGVAKLKDKSLWERAKAMIEIAHPDFREDLSRAMRKNFLR